MKIKILIVMLIGSLSIGLAQSKLSYTDKDIDNLLAEVFKEKTETLINNPKSSRKKLITDLLVNRVEVIYAPEYAEKKFNQLATLGLNNKYNKDLMIDNTYNKQIFNPIKYNLPFSVKKKQFYRIGNSNYILIIKPNK